MRGNSVIVVFSLLLLGVPAEDQTAPCDSVSVPVSVVLPDGSMLRGLESKHFEFRPLRDLRVAPDLGPRRLLLMVDLSQQLNDEAWRIAMRLATLATTKGRPSDQIGLFTFDGPVIQLPFVEPRETLTQRVAALAANRPAGENKAHVYDALMEAAKVFGPQRYGDSILLLSAGIDSGSKAKDHDVERTLQERGIRLFVLALTDDTKSHESFEIVMPTDRAIRERGTALGGSKSLLLGNVAVASGGALSSENTRPPDRAYQWNETRVKQWEAVVWSFYAQVVETYRIQVAPPRDGKPRAWELNLSAGLRRQFPSHVILYPKKPMPCAVQP